MSKRIELQSEIVRINRLNDSRKIYLRKAVDILAAALDEQPEKRIAMRHVHSIYGDGWADNVTYAALNSEGAPICILESGNDKPFSELPEDTVISILRDACNQIPE